MQPTLVCWVDIESTGLHVDRDDILEVAYLFSWLDGTRLTPTTTYLVDHPSLSSVLSKCDPQVINMHTRSGLIADLYYSVNRASLSRIDALMSDDIKRVAKMNTKPGETPPTVVIGGNSPCLDRGMMAAFLPRSYALLSHRSVDVTTLNMVFADRLPMHHHSHIPHRAFWDIEACYAQYCQLRRGIM